MKRLLAVLAVVLALAACGGDLDANVVSGGGDSASVDKAGAITARGHVVNTDEGTAYDVVLHFTFTQAGAAYLQRDLLLGDISGGNVRSFTAVFPGPAIDPATFGWSYTISWE